VASDVKLTDVTKRFGRDTAVDNVSLATQPGEFLAFLGPSGCGKTTLLRMIAGLEDVTSGTIEIQGQVVNDVPIHRRPTNMVFQKLALFPHLNVGDNVAFGLRLKRESNDAIRKRVKDALALVQLPGYEERRVTDLSGGQQQRVAIARALAMRPELLLFDEPTSALDPELVGEVLGVMRDLAGTGMTMIVVTHELGFAREVSNRVAFMDQGQLVEIGDARQVLSDPQQARTRAFISAVHK